MPVAVLSLARNMQMVSDRIQAHISLAGDLAYKKRKFRDEISQACERSRMHMEISKESFNPAAKNHLADVKATRQMVLPLRWA